MSSRSRSRDRSRSRSLTPLSAKRASSPGPVRSTSRHRSQSPSRHMRTESRSRSRSPAPREPRNGHRGRTRTRSPSRSRSLSRGGGRSYRDRSYSRSPSRDGRRLQTSKIVVEKLTKNVTEAHLREIFGSYGRIETIDLPMNRQFMTNRGTAYILYDHPSASEAAIAHMHEAQLDGAVITVSIVLSRRAFSRSPPPAKSDRKFGGARSGPVPRGPPSNRYGSPQPRRVNFGGGRRDDHSDDDRIGRPAYSRSPSPPRRKRRSPTYSRSPSRTPPRRRAPPARSPPRRRRRSPSYSSYSSYSRSRTRTRSPSRSRSPGRNRRDGRR